MVFNMIDKSQNIYSVYRWSDLFDFVCIIHHLAFCNFYVFYIFFYYQNEKMVNCPVREITPIENNLQTPGAESQF